MEYPAQLRANDSIVANLNGDHYELRFPYEPAAVEIVKRLPGARYDWKKKRWVVLARWHQQIKDAQYSIAKQIKAKAQFIPIEVGEAVTALSMYGERIGVCQATGGGYVIALRIKASDIQKEILRYHGAKWNPTSTQWEWQLKEKAQAINAARALEATSEISVTEQPHS